MKLILATVLSFGIVGKCPLKAGFWGKGGVQTTPPGPQALPLDQAGLELRQVPDPGSG